MAMPGGTSPSDVTAEIQDAIDVVRAAARREYLGVPPGVMAKVTPFEAWKIDSVLTQVVAGTNIFAKVMISADAAPPEFVHLRIHRPLPHTGKPPELVKLLKGSDAAGDLAFFG